MKTLLIWLFSLSLPVSAGALDSVSKNYKLTAFHYGNHTVLHYEQSRSRRPVAVYDQNGRKVPFERIGTYFKLVRRLDDFTVVVGNTRLKFATSRQRN